MKATLPQIVERRRQALARAWRASPLKLVKVKAAMVLGEIAYLRGGQGGGEVSAAGRRSPSNFACLRKVFSNPKFFANQQRGRRTMSWMICAKLLGQSPPRGANDALGIDRLVRFFNNTIGLPVAEAREGLTSMLAFAHR